MFGLTLTCCLLLTIRGLATALETGPTSSTGPIILVHSGAGTFPPSISEGKFLAMKAAVREAWRILEATASVTDAAEAALKVLEDDPNTDAGRGSELTISGHIEMDASIMMGENMEAGAVASVTEIRQGCYQVIFQC